MRVRTKNARVLDARGSDIEPVERLRGDDEVDARGVEPGRFGFSADGHEARERAPTGLGRLLVLRIDPFGGRCPQSYSDRRLPHH